MQRYRGSQALSVGLAWGQWSAGGSQRGQSTTAHVMRGECPSPLPAALGTATMRSLLVGPAADAQIGEAHLAWASGVAGPRAWLPLGTVCLKLH